MNYDTAGIVKLFLMELHDEEMNKYIEITINSFKVPQNFSDI